MTTTLPAAWTPAVPMSRVIVHWTAGNHRASPDDRKAYHLLVEGDAEVVRGVPGIELNSGAIKNGYAAHTLNCNTDSIGVSMCGMAGAVESPFNAGRAPLTREQFQKAAEVVAELCRRYSIPLTPRTVLFHAEVQGTLGITQRNKWDVAVLPFDRSIKGAKAVGDHFRALVAAAMGQREEAPAAAPVPNGAQARVTASRLLFRSGPGEAFATMGDGLPRDTVLRIETVQGEWAAVVTPAGYQGWVALAHLDVFDGPPAVEPTAPDPTRQFIAQARKMLDDLEARL